MEKIIEACKEFDYDWLPADIGSFRLVVTGPDIIKSRSEGHEEGTTVTKLPFFYYENDLGWRWEALYDSEVEDFTVHVRLPLFEFVDISFIRPDAHVFWQCLKDRCEQSIKDTCIDTERNMSFTYKRKGLKMWDFSEFLPSEAEGFIRDVDPVHAIRIINGSYIIAEYRYPRECTGLLLYYNELRDEFFGELRYKNHPEINHRLDAKSVDELEIQLRNNLNAILKELGERDE